ncbi:hypothetical protein DIURU_001387 [Diutina rugosa]|uniref:non-specific serine/threonine protein kinase n=1 Tax=Diutina rugosa TaxID=5481 RepID=A0A642UUB6_DIURU|nr:uncharacterized protein DIURU_001387 [Diutina rugosa]KAA8905725.1 hypothetical protein DIURU_001387 [Diutina rugosa]
MTSDSVDQVGCYRIVEEIGEGAFGKVYLASHIILDTKVVLKCGRKDDPNIVREIYYHKQLKHRNIVSLYEVIKTENHIWLVLEYCAGGELFYHIYDHKRLSADHARSLFFQIVLAVKYVHSLNLSHRDLKLENILFADVKRTKVKLSDFGFVREVQPRQQLQTICGTSVYMAPEMVQGAKYSGFAVDIWALGIILYTMVYGELPFDDDNDFVVKERIVNSHPRISEAVPPEINELVVKLLSKDPQLRPNINEILNSPFLIDTYSEYTEKDCGAVADAESIISIHQHYHYAKAPLSSKLERTILKRLKKLGVNLESLEASVYKNEMNPLTAFYELLLTEELAKKKQKYMREKKRRYYEARKSLRRSSQRVKSVLSLSDQGSISSQTGLSFLNSRRSTDISRPDPHQMSPKKPATAITTPESASIMQTLADPQPVISSNGREVQFSEVSPVNSTSGDSSRRKYRDGKLLTKLQFWKKHKRSTESLEGATLKEKPSLDQLTIPSQNGSYPDVVEPVPVTAVPAPLLDDANALELNQQPPISEKKDTPSPIRAVSSQPGSSSSQRRPRPLSIVSQVSQLSNLSHFSAMTESELDILDESESDDDISFDDGMYDSSLNNSQDLKSQTGSLRNRKKRPAYPRRQVSDISARSKLSQLSSNSSDESEVSMPVIAPIDPQPRPTSPVPRSKRWKSSVFSMAGGVDPVALGTGYPGGPGPIPSSKDRNSPPVATFNRLNLRLKRHGGGNRDEVGPPGHLSSPMDEKRPWMATSTPFDSLIEEEEE